MLGKAASASLRAPIDGIVSLVFHRDGERVPRGALVAFITSPHPDHIVGYVRAPTSVRPEPGMAVRVRSLGPDRRIWPSTVLRVGADLQVLGVPVQSFAGEGGGQPWSQLLPGLLGPGLQRGLPFLIAIPAGMQLLPGEQVSITLMP